MGYSGLRIVESFTVLRELSDECLGLLKKGAAGDTTDRVLRIHERVRELPELLKIINYDWERVPGEWDDSVKEWNELISLRRELAEHALNHN